jgi:hypothetical protein
MHFRTRYMKKKNSLLSFKSHTFESLSLTSHNQYQNLFKFSGSPLLEETYQTTDYSAASVSQKKRLKTYEIIYAIFL